MKIDLEALCFETEMLVSIQYDNKHKLKTKFTISECNIKKLIGVEFFNECITVKKNNVFLKPISIYYFANDKKRYNSIEQIINQLEKTK